MAETAQESSNESVKPAAPNKGGWLKRDLPASLVVFLVALPLCLGIALASGAPLFAGIIAGVVGGIVVGFSSGSHLSVSGPAAGLAVIVAGAITSLGSFQTFQLAVVIAGAIQILFGTFRLGMIANFVPHAVIKGMLAGIGVVIVLKQIPHALGRDKDYEGNFAFLERAGENTFTDIIRAFMSLSPAAVIISVLGLLLIVLWDKPFMKRMGWTKVVPGPLVAVLVGTLLHEMLIAFIPNLALTDREHFVSLPIFSSMDAFISVFQLPDWSKISMPAVWTTGLVLAIVASLESLLSLDAADKLDEQKRISPPSRELIAQGVGNATSGLIGGIPITSVVVRTSANAYAGAATKASTILHGAFLFIAAVALPTWLNRIPLACLAAVLISVGYKLARPALFKEMYAHGRNQFLPFILTLLGVVFVDLLKGVIAGLVVGLYYVLRGNQHQAITMVNQDNYYLIRFNKDITFLQKTALKEHLASVPDGSNLIIHGHQAVFVDDDIIETINDFLANAAFRNITIELKEVAKRPDHRLKVSQA